MGGRAHSSLHLQCPFDFAPAWFLASTFSAVFVFHVLSLGFVTAVAFICWLLALTWMSESSDTTHEAILHNLVAHQAALRRQVSQVQTDLQFVKDQLSQILERLQQSQGPPRPQDLSGAEADRGFQDQHDERSGR